MEAALNGVKYDEFLEELKTLNLFFPGHFMAPVVVNLSSVLSLCTLKPPILQ